MFLAMCNVDDDSKGLQLLYTKKSYSKNISNAALKAYMRTQKWGCTVSQTMKALRRYDNTICKK